MLQRYPGDSQFTSDNQYASATLPLCHSEVQSALFEVLLLPTQTISWKWLVPKVYDSSRKPIFFSLVFFIFVSLLGLACWNSVNASISMAFVVLQPLIISPCSLPLCRLEVLIFLVWPPVLVWVAPRFFHLPFAGLSRNPVSLLSVTNLTQLFKSRCFGLTPHTLHGAGQSSMLIWFGGVGADRKGELLQSPLSEHSLEIACCSNDTRGNDSLGFFSVSSNLNGVISKAWGS